MLGFFSVPNLLQILCAERTINPFNAACNCTQQQQQADIYFGIAEPFFCVHIY